MNDTMIDTDKVKALIVALNSRERAKAVSAPEDNPLNNFDLKALEQGAGIMKGADLFPAKDMAVQGGLGYDMEVSRNAKMREAQTDKSARRMAEARARAARKVELDSIATKPAQVSKKRMDEAWLVVFHLVTIVTQIVKSKQRWAERFLGTNEEDVAQMTLMNLALVLAKSDKDLALMRAAAKEMGDYAEETGRVPGEQMTKDERKERKEIQKARKWLMGVVHNRVMGTLVDSFMRVSSAGRESNLDIIATVMANINQVGGDPITSRFKADKAPSFLGTRFQTPGGIDSGLMAAAINAAITERGLDRMVELLLDDEYRRTDGRVRWSKVAEQVFLAAPGVDGQWMWDMVCKDTEAKCEDPAKARGVRAKLLVRSEFEFLPHLIVSLVESFDPHSIGWAAQPKAPVYATNSEPIRGLATVRLITGTSVVAAPNRAFDGAVDKDGIHWPMTGGQPVGDEVGAEFREAEEVVMPWTTRDSKVRRARHTQAIMASDFELFYLGDEPEKRQGLVPALKFGSAEEAAAALLETLSNLIDGEEFVKSAVNA